MTQSTKTPELLVEKLVHGNLSDVETQAVLRRLEAEGGLGRIDALKASNSDILSEYPPAQLAASIRMRHEISEQEKWKKRRLALLPLFAAVAAAAAIALFMILPVAPNNGAFSSGGPADVTAPGAFGGDTRIKGDGAPMLNVGKRTVEGQEWLKNGESVAAGDELQIKFNAGLAHSLVICSVDGRGEISLHYPQSESDSTKVVPLSEKILPYGYTLDDAPRFERFILVWSEDDKPVSVRDVLKSVTHMSNAQSSAPKLDKGYRFKDMTLSK